MGVIQIDRTPNHNMVYLHKQTPVFHNKWQVPRSQFKHLFYKLTILTKTCKLIAFEEFQHLPNIQMYFI